MIAHPVFFAFVALASVGSGFALGFWYRSAPTAMARPRFDGKKTLAGVRIEDLQKCRDGFTNNEEKRP